MVVALNWGTGACGRSTAVERCCWNVDTSKEAFDGDDDRQ